MNAATAPALLGQSVYDAFSDAAAARPDHLFIADGRHRLSYREVDALATRFADRLAAAGVRPGDRVVTWLPTTYEWAVTALALARMGAINVLANTRYTEAELEHVLVSSEASALIHPVAAFERDYRRMAEGLATELGTTRGQQVATIAFELGQAPEVTFATSAPPPSPPHRTRPEDVLYIIFTSGTTGAPKGSMTRHGQALQSAFNSGRRQRFTADERLLCFLPMYHCFGAVNAFLNVITHRATLHLAEFEPHAILRLIEAERITALYAVPTNLILMAQAHRELGDQAPDLSSWQRGITGGGELPAEMIDYLTTVIGVGHLTSAYGMTECSAIITQSDHDDPVEVRLGTVGRPMPGVEMRAVDAGEALQEIQVRGYTVHAGYWGMDPTTSLVDGTWFATGDCGRMREDGSWTIHGRVKDMYKSSGFNVYPLEIETELLKHPSIVEAAVVGVTHPTLIEAGVAYVVPAPSAVIDEGEVREFLRERLAKFKVPLRVISVDALPRSTATLKIQKFELRRRAAGLFEDAGSAR